MHGRWYDVQALSMKQLVPLSQRRRTCSHTTPHQSIAHDEFSQSNRSCLQYVGRRVAESVRILGEDAVEESSLSRFCHLRAYLASHLALRRANSTSNYRGRVKN